MFEFLKDLGNYESRKVGRDDVNGLTVSTAYTSDEGYETAILDEKDTYPVERYADKVTAEIGHKKWVKDAETLTEVKVLDGMGGFVPQKNAVVVRKK